MVLERASRKRLLRPRASQACRKLFQLGNALAHGQGAPIAAPVCTEVEDRILGILALVLLAALVPAWVRAAEALLLRGVPVQDGEVNRVAKLTRTMVLADVY